MIPLTRGFGRSIVEHNIKTEILADWMEGCALFGKDKRMSGSEMVSLLVEEEIYDDQGFCWQAIDYGLKELRRRSRLNVGYPLSVSDQRVERLVNSWRDVPVQCFLLLLTLAQRYDKWTKVMPRDYNLQGELFEEVTRQSLARQFPDWVIYPTGWTRAHPTRLPKLVSEIADRLGEIRGDVAAWAPPHANEAGLDLLCYRPFKDGHVGVPLLLLQCASGDWDAPGKVRTPDIELWMKLVSFASKPKRAFATPFSFLKDDFRRVSQKVNGVLLDRHRLLGTKAEQEWASASLRRELLKWVRARVRKLAKLGS